MAANSLGGAHQTDREILGYSRWIVFIAAFLSMAVISPYEYAWSSMSGHIGGIYHWSHTQIGWMFTLFVDLRVGRDAAGRHPARQVRAALGDRRSPAWSRGLGIYATSLGPTYGMVLVLWCIGSLFAGFIYNTAVTTANKWFPDKRGVTAGLIAGAFSWGSLPFIFPIRAIPKTAPDATFFHVIYLMAAIIGGVCDRRRAVHEGPAGRLAPAGWVPAKAIEARHRAPVHPGRGALDLADVGADRLLHSDLERRPRRRQQDREVLEQLPLHRGGGDRGGRRHRHLQRSRPREPGRRCPRRSAAKTR